MVKDHLPKLEMCDFQVLNYLVIYFIIMPIVEILESVLLLPTSDVI